MSRSWRSRSSEYLFVDGGDVLPCDAQRVANLVDALLDTPGGLERLADLIGTSVVVLEGATPARIRELAISALAGGDRVLVRVRRAPRPVEAPGPLDVPKGGGDDPEAPLRPTWISIEVVHERGELVPGLTVSVTLPDDAERSDRLDVRSHWRADDVPRSGSTCMFRFRAPEPRRITGPSIALREDDVWVAPVMDHGLRLTVGRHHRVVIVQGHTEVGLVDRTGRPVAGQRCRVIVGGRELEGRTDAAGIYAAHHPRQVEVCDVEFPELDNSAWRFKESAEIGEE